MLRQVQTGGMAGRMAGIADSLALKGDEQVFQALVGPDCF